MNGGAAEPAKRQKVENDDHRSPTFQASLIEIDHLRDHFPLLDSKAKLGPRVRSQVPYSNVITDDQGVLVNVVVGGKLRESCNLARESTLGVLQDGNGNTADDIPRQVLMYPRCGPRGDLFFEPSTVIAAIVTCGGLCPGLNSVVRDITLSLFELYGVKQVYGFHGGWEGIYARPPTTLTRENTIGIQNLGGTILSSGRGGFELEKIIEALDKLNINQLYVVGGDGTMRGACALSEGMRTHRRPIAVIGVPKTIDNDIDLIDRSFGFQTAVEETLRAVRAAKVEASCSINGIGIVKVMGRSAGFIATHVTLASGDVDLCLVPEVPIVFDGSPHCHFNHIAKVVQERGSAVIVLSEGAGEEILGRSAEVDAGGNRKLPEVGPWVKDQVIKMFRSKGMQCVVKYIDPSYMVRSGPANASDALYCLILSQGAVHAAMAGLTNCCVGLVNGRSVLLPITSVVSTSPRAVDPKGRTWERVVSLTGQPNSDPPGVTKYAKVSAIAKGLMSHTIL